MVLFCLSAVLTPPHVFGATWYVSPSGLAGNAGSLGSPWDLQTAMVKTNSIHGGDTVYLRGGTYQHIPQGVSAGNEGYIFSCDLFGTVSGAPIIVRSYPGERAVIDGYAYGGATYGFHANARPTFRVGRTGNSKFGCDIWFQDITFTSTSTEPRFSPDDSSFPAAITRSDGVAVFGDRVKFINCTIHDCAAGFSGWSDAKELEVNGCVIYNNGWTGTPHMHGHGIYSQTYNSSNPGKTFRHNAIINGGYDNGGQFYGSGTVESSHYRIGTNVFSGSALHGRFLMGVRNNSTCIDDRVQDNQIIGNIGYGVDLVDFYQQDACAYKDLIVVGNYFRGTTLQTASWKSQIHTNNFYFDRSFLQDSTSRPAAGQILSIFTNAVAWPTWTFDRNTYYLLTGTAAEFNIQGAGLKTPAQWKSISGFDANSTFTATFPATNRIDIWPSDYDTNVAKIVINNWGMSNSIPLALTSLPWSPGDTFLLRATQNYDGDIASGTLGATTNLTISMLAAAHAPAIPYGDVTPLNPTTFPYFGVFVIERTSAAPPPPPATTYTLSYASVNPSSGVTITITPNDNGGLGSGVTAFARTNNQNVVTTNTAPATAGGANFSEWHLNGAFYSSSTACLKTNVANDTLTAIYVTPTHDLTVDASGSGGAVTVAVSPADINGASNGLTSFVRTFNEGTVITLQLLSPAPNGNLWSEWLFDGSSYSTNQTTSITNDAAHTLTAKYVPKPPITNTPSGRFPTKRRP